ncbi:MAG: SDR family oxidoreductase [bacterium]|nr:SDR family oxidoreductase [bacterium]
MTSFEGKLVLITGASSGIGRQLAFDFAARGARPVLVARRGDRLRLIAAEIRQRGSWAGVISCDLAVASQRQSLIEQVDTEFGTPDILINNAGFGHYRLFVRENPAEISRTLEVNYTAPAHLMSAFLPGMIKKGSGAIVNISSGAGKVALPFMASYCASKFALCALTEAVSYELSGSGVTVHLVNPGPVDSEFFAAGVWEGSKPHKLVSPQQVSDIVQSSILKDRLIAYCPPTRGLMVYVFNLLGPLGRWAVRRKYRT